MRRASPFDPSITRPSVLQMAVHVAGPVNSARRSLFTRPTSAPRPPPLLQPVWPLLTFTVFFCVFVVSLRLNRVFTCSSLVHQGGRGADCFSEPNRLVEDSRPWQVFRRLFPPFREFPRRPCHLWWVILPGVVWSPLTQTHSRLECVC